MVCQERVKIFMQGCLPGQDPLPLAWEAWLGLHPSLLVVTWCGSQEALQTSVRCDESSGDGLTHLLITESTFQPNFQKGGFQSNFFS